MFDVNLTQVLLSDSSLKEVRKLVNCLLLFINYQQFKLILRTCPSLRDR